MLPVRVRAMISRIGEGYIVGVGESEVLLIKSSNSRILVSWFVANDVHTWLMMSMGRALTERVVPEICGLVGAVVCPKVAL